MARSGCARGVASLRAGGGLAARGAWPRASAHGDAGRRLVAVRCGAGASVESRRSAAPALLMHHARRTDAWSVPFPEAWVKRGLAEHDRGSARDHDARSGCVHRRVAQLPSPTD